MTEAHMHKDGADHIWQQVNRGRPHVELIQIDYRCVCGATRTVVRYLFREANPDESG